MPRYIAVNPEIQNHIEVPTLKGSSCSREIANRLTGPRDEGPCLESVQGPTSAHTHEREREIERESESERASERARARERARERERD